MTRPLNTFNFITDYNERLMHETALIAITQLELWDFMQNFSGESFMSSRQPEIMQIYLKIEQLGYGLHSSASFGCIMRSMEYIAVNGIDEYREYYLSNFNNNNNVNNNTNNMNNDNNNNDNNNNNNTNNNANNNANNNTNDNNQI
uniref:Uncharacterized protein n=1 Tax=viral metagenome TaxID=1070528 RepID=A0A6C0HZ58_9ZZZZ